jgi:WhiB family redox-sensing transcriptional regulator
MTTLPLSLVISAAAQDSRPVTERPLDVLTKRVIDGAGCDGKPTDDWFPYEPPQDRSQARAAYEENARKLCAGCPVVEECLERALRIEAQYNVRYAGIFGGRAPWERKALNRRRRRRRAAARQERAGVSA